MKPALVRDGKDGARLAVYAQKGVNAQRVEAYLMRNGW
jgi:hypothetical protein